MAERPRLKRGRSYLALTLIAGACAGLLVATERLTGQQIADNERRHELSQIVALTGAVPAPSTGWKGNVWQLCNGTALVRQDVSGYGGTLSLLLAVTLTDGRDLSLRGVRVTHHQETPGLADFLEHPEHGWLAKLNGRSAPEVAKVQAVSGATITSRAVVRGVLAGLEAARQTGRGCG